MLDKVTCAILGSLVGAAVTYILMRKHCDEVINEEVRQMKEYYASKNEKKEKVVQPQTPEERLADIVVANLTKRVEREPVDYTTAKGKEERRTLLITSERFQNEEPEFEKITLDFYEKDGVLADSYGDIVDIEQSIGIKAISYFQALGQEVIYIRNLDLGIDYEIVLEHSSYKEEYESGFRDGKY